MEGNVLIVLVAYFIGNFSTSYFVGKIFGKIDIREHGSGNAGSTNVVRTLGIKAGVLTFLGDLLKGILAIYLGKKVGGSESTLVLLCGIAVVLGHNWPLLLGFKGGKGVATSIGVVLTVAPVACLICLFIGVSILVKSKYVSLGSVSALGILPIVVLFLDYEMKFFYFGLILGLLAIYRHRDNIKRLLSGTERKIGEKSIVK